MSLADLKEDARELNGFLEAATRPKVKDVLSLAIRKLETEIISREEAEKKKENGSESEEKKSEPKKPTASKRYTKDITTYAWDQSDKFMKIYITAPGVHTINKDDVTSEFTTSSFRVRINNCGPHDMTCGVAFLWEDINTESSYHKIKTDMVLVMLRKVKEASTWAYVTKKDKKAIEKQKEKKPDASDMGKGDPEAGLMDMMKKMYDEGDDDMKRTIAKAWTESRDKKGAPGAGGGDMGGMGGLGGDMMGMGGLGGGMGMGGLGGGMGGMGGLGGDMGL